jgi:hypothetical protein
VKLTNVGYCAAEAATCAKMQQSSRIVRAISAAKLQRASETSGASA